MAGHNHRTRDIKAPGVCPACDQIHIGWYPKESEMTPKSDYDLGYDTGFNGHIIFTQDMSPEWQAGYADGKGDRELELEFNPEIQTHFGQSGRGEAGKLRNVARMKDKKLMDIVAAVRLEDNDPEAKAYFEGVARQRGLL